MQNEPKAVLWDLGNVVVRWEPESILTNFGFGPDETEFLRRELLGHRDWLRLDQGLISEGQFADRLHRESSLTMSDVLRCFDVVRESLTDINESVELIQQLYDANIPMYVLSNMSEVNANYLRQRPYFRQFGGVIISAEEKLIKPDPKIFQCVLRKFNLRAEDFYFIDDSEANTKTAASMGFHTLHFHRSSACYQKIKKTFGLL